MCVIGETEKNVEIPFNDLNPELLKYDAGYEAAPFGRTRNDAHV